MKEKCDAVTIVDGGGSINELINVWYAVWYVILGMDGLSIFKYIYLCFIGKICAIAFISLI